MITIFIYEILAIKLCFRNHALLNMNIKGNNQSHAVTSLMTLSRHWRCNRGFGLHNFPCRHRIWSPIKAIMYRTWILKILENGADFRPPAIFKTETEVWVYRLDAPQATGRWWHLVPRCAIKKKLIELWQFQNLAYFSIWWRHRCLHEYVTHNLHNYISTTIYLQNIACVAPVFHS